MIDIKFNRTPFVSQILKGIGQIMLQENSLTGVLFLGGLFIGSWKFGVACLLATIAGTLIAHVLRYDKEEINAGLYGFSPALVGVVLVFLFQDSAFIWILVIIGGILAAMLQHAFIIRKIPAYTFPFILVTWVLIFFLRHFDLAFPSEFTTQDFISTDSDSKLVGFRSFGQVIFQSKTISGLLFFIGVSISNLRAGLFGFTFAILASFASMVLGQETESIYMGLLGFNTVLTAIGLTGKESKDVLWLIFGVTVTILFDHFLFTSGIINPMGVKLTSPFVLGMWITLALRKYLKKASD